VGGLGGKDGRKARGAPTWLVWPGLWASIWATRARRRARHRTEKCNEHFSVHLRVLSLFPFALTRRASGFSAEKGWEHVPWRARPLGIPAVRGRGLGIAASGGAARWQVVGTVGGCWCGRQRRLVRGDGGAWRGAEAAVGRADRWLALGLFGDERRLRVWRGGGSWWRGRRQLAGGGGLA